MPLNIKVKASSGSQTHEVDVAIPVQTVDEVTAKAALQIAAQAVNNLSRTTETSASIFAPCLSTVVPDVTFIKDQSVDLRMNDVLVLKIYNLDDESMFGPNLKLAIHRHAKAEKILEHINWARSPRGFEITYEDTTVDPKATLEENYINDGDSIFIASL